METESTDIAPDRPLCVDLDGTIVRTDLLFEAVVSLLTRNILYALLFPGWLLKGKAHFKQQIADRVDLKVSVMPYNAPLLAYLKQQRALGRRLVLISATNRRFAEAVAAHLGLFDEVFASDAITNLTGRRKLELLRNRFGEQGFDYAGNARVDLEIWPNAEESIVVSPERGVLEIAREVSNVVKVFDDRDDGIGPYLRVLRPHQWLKNVLVFVPLILAHHASEPVLLLRACLAFVAFGLCASSVYVLNDLMDLPSDRQHPAKSRRALAAGAIAIKHAAVIIPFLLVASFLVAQWLPPEFTMVLVFYYVTTLAYSYRLKRAALVDVLTLAGLYTIRIIAGAVAVSVVTSFWLLAFSTFLFLSLALVKRYTELLTLRDEGKVLASGRGYYPSDLETLVHFGSTAGYMAVLVLALYINSDAISGQYRTPQMIWLQCPLLLYLISRIWLLARRNQLNEDPVVFVTRDRHSQLVALIALALLWAAI